MSPPPVVTAAACPTLLPFVRRAALAAAIGSCAGCVPYPVHKLVQPAASIRVQNAQGRPLEGARVELRTGYNPYGREAGREVQLSDAEGRAVFPARREWQTESLMIHGWRDYFWHWCVRREGFATFEGERSRGDRFADEAVVTLRAGASSACEAAAS